MSMKNIDMKALCKQQHVYKGGGLVTGILMFLTITSHSSPLSHQQVGVTMPLSMALVRIGEAAVQSACTESSAPSMSGKTTNPFGGSGPCRSPPCPFPFCSSHNLKEFIDRRWDPGSPFTTQTVRSGNNVPLD